MGLAIVLAYVALNLLSPADMFPTLASYRIMLILALVSLAPVVFAFLQSPEITKSRQFFLVILFFGFASCSWFPHGGLRANLDTFLAIMPNILMYFFGVAQLRSPLRLGFLRATLLIVSIYVISTAYSQISYVRATQDSTPYVLAGGEDAASEVRIRGLGMLNDPNILGQYFLLILPLLFVSTKKTGLGPGYFLAIPLAMLLVFGIYLTNSRGAESGVAVLIGLFLIHRFKKAGAVGSAIVGLLALGVINATRSRTISMTGGLDRLAIWSDGMAFVKSSPLWGIGVGGFMQRDGWTAHNSYLLCAAEVGLLGFFLWMSILVVTLIQLHRVTKVLSKSNPSLVRWAVAVKLALGTYLFTSFFLSCTYSLTLFLLLGMSGAIIAAAGGDKVIPLAGTKWPILSLGICVATITLIYIMLRLRIV